MLHYENWVPESEIHAVVGVAGACIGLAWSLVALRIYVRGFIIKALGWDDWLMLLTLAFFTAESVVLIIIVDSLHVVTGLGNFSELSKLAGFFLLEVALYICTSMTLKLSLAVFFLRVVIEPWQRWVIRIGLVVYIIFAATLLFIAVFECGNPASFLIHSIEGRCLKWSAVGPLVYLHTILNAIVDWTFSLLPILFIHRTQLPKQTRVSVSIVLFIGALGSVASVVRIGYIKGLQPSSGDFFAQAVDIGIASNLELGLGISAGSLATLRPLLKIILGRLRSRTSSANQVNDGPPHGGLEAHSGGRGRMIEVLDREKRSPTFYNPLRGSDGTGTTGTTIVTTITGNSPTLETDVMLNYISKNGSLSPGHDFHSSPDGQKTPGTFTQITVDDGVPSQEAESSAGLTIPKPSPASLRTSSRREIWEDVALGGTNPKEHEQDLDIGDAKVEPEFPLPGSVHQKGC